MKKLIFIPLLLVSMILSATNYYVKTGGSDAANGLTDGTAWATVTKVNTVWAAGTFAPGDSILFNKGNTFAGVALSVRESGTSINPIVVGAYGSGADPIITGFTTLTGWTSEGGGVYSKVITASSQTKMVTIDGVQYGVGRYPDATYRTYESFSTHHSITDNGLGDATDWAGAQVVVRKNNWTLDVGTITDHTGDVITYTDLGSGQSGTNNYGYFIQNDLRCVTAYGEWYHDYAGTGKFYMFFGATDPDTKTVKVATISGLLTNVSYDYIHITDISFVGCINGAAAYTYQNDYCVIKNCSFSFVGTDAIRFFGVGDLAQNNTFDYINGIGVYSYGADVVIQNNIVTNVGLIEGAAVRASFSYGLFAEQANPLIQFNYVSNCGYTGIAIGAGTASGVFSNNVIDSCCLILSDGGGIYVYGTHTNIIIDGNIVSNSQGHPEGTTYTVGYGEGIYLDESADHITVTNNTCFGNTNSGIKLHKAHDNTIEDNTCYNNAFQMRFESWEGVSQIRNNVMLDNFFIARSLPQFAMMFMSLSNDINLFGTADSNFYAKPLSNDSIRIWQGSYSNKTIAGWKTYSGQDANSNGNLGGAAVTIDSLHFIYNDSTYIRQWTLSKAMNDVENISYSGEISLNPFTSLVLIGDGTVTPYYGEIDPPDAPVVFTGVVDNISPIWATIRGEVTDDGDDAVTDRGLCWSLSVDPLITDSHVHLGSGVGTFTYKMIGLHGGETYHIKAFAINTVGTSYGADVSFTTPVRSVMMKGGKVLRYNGKTLIVR